eukprot:TRINITY_DN2005_c0_g1_i1.p1 TRINITY_DN2005_c0_g1~~TRINITY_DN2005_c0_g1_i1.p1  ORF type:complete len:574 (-),score=59.38 TRINITY_DN2005_c0_g1_i1:74-1795(-)
MYCKNCTGLSCQRNGNWGLGIDEGDFKGLWRTKHQRNQEQFNVGRRFRYCCLIQQEQVAINGQVLCKSSRKKQKQLLIMLRSIIQILRNGLNYRSECIRLKGRYSNAFAVQLNPRRNKYLIRWVQQNLKIGAAEATMQSALIRALILSKKVTGSEDEIERVVKQGICEFPDEELVVKILMAHGLDGIKLYCQIKPGVPVKPMLAKPMKDISLILKRFENIKFTCEYKYDGLRGQVHFVNKKCQIYSRNQGNLTEQYPDIIDFLVSNVSQDVDSFILDSEIVAIDVNTNKILPFQILSTRGRKNVEKEQIEIQVCLFIFDLLYLNGTSLLKKPLSERRDLLHQTFKPVQNKLCFVESKDVQDFEQIEELLHLSIKDGCEGLMIKTLDTNSTYEPAKRSFKWLKLKKDYLEKGLGDTLDLVPIAAFYGIGKRTGLYGSFLLACYNDEMDRFETCCKTGTGFSDENLEKLYQILSQTTTSEPSNEYKLNGFKKADVWFSPTIVWEIKAADFQLSPIYTAAISDFNDEKGIGLRFPRLMRIREDKKPYDATTSKFILDMYKQQANIASFDFKDDEMY